MTVTVLLAVCYFTWCVGALNALGAFFHVIDTFDENRDPKVIARRLLRAFACVVPVLGLAPTLWCLWRTLHPKPPAPAPDPDRADVGLVCAQCGAPFAGGPHR